MGLVVNRVFQMTFTQAIKAGFRNYFTFSGRAARSEYWWFILFVVIVSIVLSLLDGAVFGTDPQTGDPRSILESVWGLAVFIPVLSVGWRRLQDTGRAGYWILLPGALGVIFILSAFAGIGGLGLIYSAGVDPAAVQAPAAMSAAWGVMAFGLVYLVVAVMMLWWLTRPSQPGPNQYGPMPGQYAGH